MHRYAPYRIIMQCWSVCSYERADVQMCAFMYVDSCTWMRIGLPQCGRLLPSGESQADWADCLGYAGCGRGWPWNRRGGTILSGCLGLLSTPYAVCTGTNLPTHTHQGRPADPPRNPQDKPSGSLAIQAWPLRPPIYSKLCARPSRGRAETSESKTSFTPPTLTSTAYPKQIRAKSQDISTGQQDDCSDCS